jgi:hypothetical protein
MQVLNVETFEDCLSIVDKAGSAVGGDWNPNSKICNIKGSGRDDTSTIQQHDRDGYIAFYNIGYM